MLPPLYHPDPPRFPQRWRFVPENLIRGARIIFAKAVFWGCREETAPCFFTAWKNPHLCLSAKYLCRKPKPRASVAAFCQKSAVQPCKSAFGFAKAHTMKPSPFRICRKKKPWGAQRCHPDKRGGAWVSFDCGRTVQERNIKTAPRGRGKADLFLAKTNMIKSHLSAGLLWHGRCAQAFFGWLSIKAPRRGGIPCSLCRRKGRALLPAHAQSKSILDRLLYKQLTSSLSFFSSGQARGCKRWGLP